MCMSYNQEPYEELFELEEVVDELEISNSLKNDLSGWLSREKRLAAKLIKNDKRRKDRFSD